MSEQQSSDGAGRRGFFNRPLLFGASIGVGLLFMIIGVLAWGGFNWGMELSNTMTFCTSCHEMADNVYAEYVGTVHDVNRSGVRATCSDCHVPRPWVYKVIRKIRATNELYHKALGTVNTPEKFAERRLTLAKKVWQEMKATDSRECRNCHDFGTMDAAVQTSRARKQHLFAMENGHTCIDCHKGIAHTKAHDQLTEEELEELNQPMAAYIRAVPQSFLDGMERAAAADAIAEVAKNAEAQRVLEQREAEKAAERSRIDDAVAEALAAYQAQAGGTGQTVAAAGSAAADSGGFDVSWDGVPAREFTLFYPGQSSMEWILRGKDHDGARPLKAGDRCIDCHEAEAAEIGARIVAGESEKLEPSVIPDKRGAIPVTVQATHDGESLYMRFQWPDTAHAPVPFVEGGKMDPDNAAKLALMFATDEVEYADRAGCWGTCHHDLRSMPDHPQEPAAAGLTLNLENGVTKYIKESRTKIEVRGRGKKPLGGWSNLKDDDALQAAMSDGHYMDILRYLSSGGAEDGHVLAQREMSGGQGVEFAGGLDGDTWSVVMKRSLESSAPGDVSIAPGQLYNIGFAIHDDYSNSRFHHVSMGYKLGLDNPEAEINAVAQ